MTQEKILMLWVDSGARFCFKTGRILEIDSNDKEAFKKMKANMKVDGSKVFELVEDAAETTAIYVFAPNKEKAIDLLLRLSDADICGYVLWHFSSLANKHLSSIGKMQMNGHIPKDDEKKVATYYRNFVDRANIRTIFGKALHHTTKSAVIKAASSMSRIRHPHDRELGATF